MAKLLKPDAQLAALEKRIRKAKTQEERDAIQLEIDARTSEIMQETGFTNIGFGSGGMYVPGGGQGVGSEILEPTGVPGVYSKSTITSDTSVDPYGRKSVGNTGNLKVFYDENGNQLTPEQVAKSGVGASFAAAGWDIGFGTGNIGVGTPSAITTSDDSVISDPSASSTSDFSSGVTVVSTYADPTTGDVTAVMSDGTTKVLAKSGKQEAERKSAYDLLYSEFNNLGIGGLVPELRSFIEEGVSPAEFTLRLRQTDSYKKRFAANAQRVAKGLRALSEAEYIGLEDQFQDIMRRYGLPESYYARGDMGRQVGFEQLIANDVSNVELEDRISTAQRRVLNANPEVTQALRQFYPDISNGEILAYTLDPKNAIEQIKRKITAAEIGGAAVRSGLTTNVADAEYLQRYGVTKETAEQGYTTISGGLQRGSQLASMYGESPYTQATAEQEVFNVPGAQEARKQRQKITGLEKATFGGQSGLTSSALTRDRAGGY
jgi:hypothetical protein